MGEIALRGVTKNFGSGSANAVDDVSIEIEDGEFLVLVGPSGCGKSTLLRMLAGIESVSGGEIRINGVDATHAAPKARDIAMVFQSYALYPHMTVAENLEFGLKLRKMPKAERRARVAEILKLLRLDTLEKRRPGQLSGGQRQRVAMGRAMVREPSAFLMDEPLSNLDAKLRVAMRAELARLHDRVGVTTVYVTHDQIEAMTLGDRVAVLKDGVLQQIDTPQALYHKPANVFVAAFIGSPTMNLVQAVLADGRLSFADHSVSVPSHIDVGSRSAVLLGIRPSDFEFSEEADARLPRMKVSVEVVENLGSETHVVFPVDAPRVDTEMTAGLGAVEDTDDRLLSDARSLFTAALPARRAIEVGDEIELAIDLERVQLFDVESGLSLGLETRDPLSPGVGRSDLLV